LLDETVEHVEREVVVAVRENLSRIEHNGLGDDSNAQSACRAAGSSLRRRRGR
jgi:hypothetical protein